MLVPVDYSQYCTVPASEVAGVGQPFPAAAGAACADSTLYDSTGMTSPRPLHVQSSQAARHLLIDSCEHGTTLQKCLLLHAGYKAPSFGISLVPVQGPLTLNPYSSSCSDR